MKTAGIDLGTTTISAVVADAESGKLILSKTEPNVGFIPNREKWVREQNADEIIGRAIRLLDMITSQFPDIAAVGITGQMHGFLYTDAQGNAVSPLFTWQDRRGDQREFDGKSICEIAYVKYQEEIHAGYALATHLYNHKKGIVPVGAAGIYTIMDYLCMKLTGKTKMLIHASNADSFGFFNLNNNTFREESLEEEGVNTALLPAVTPDICIIGSYRDIAVYLPIGDNQAGFLGSVKNAHSDILVNVGTGGQVTAMTEGIIYGRNIETRPLTGNRHIVVGASLCGGRAYAMLNRFFREYLRAGGYDDKDQYEVMDTLARACFSQKCELPHVITTFAGTRDEPETRGAILELSENNFTPAAIILGTLTGMSEELYRYYLTMRKGGLDRKKRIVASGNGIRKNPTLQQVICSKFEMPLSLAEHEEEAAYGAAMLYRYVS